MLRTAMAGARAAPDDRIGEALRSIERRATVSTRDRLLADVGLDAMTAPGRWPATDPLRDGCHLSARSLALDGLR